MRTNPSKLAQRLLVVAIVGVLGGALAAAAPASASDSHARPPALAETGYLALGDSVTFGYRESNAIPPPNYTQPTSLVGYPEDVASDLSLDDTNASCPGETSASLIDASAPSNGCENGYRALFPLHVSYTGSQLDFAVNFLEHHRQTRIVSLMIGANDGFLCQRTTADHCVSELPAVLHSVATNVSTILDAIRRQAHYPGQLVVVNYYSLDYADPAQTAQSVALNKAVDAAAAPYNVQIADGFGAFQAAAMSAGGDTCAAGLLTVLSGGGCGIHPSAEGQALLAQAVEQVVRTVP